MNRRQALKSLLAGALEAAGAVVLASSVVQAAAAAATPTDGDVKKRADALAATDGSAEDGEGFVGFRNFRNGGFPNGGFRNFRNGGFPNGGFRNFRNGGFPNGGGGFRNFRNAVPY